MVSSQIIPAAIEYQSTLASSIDDVLEVLGTDVDLLPQKELLKNLVSSASKLISLNNTLKTRRDSALGIADEVKRATYYCTDIKPLMEEVRDLCDELENMIDDELWPMPKFWEILFIS